jgi:hypothetical protein
MNKTDTKFFHYRQNNSGGLFIKNNEVDVLVVIEAADYLHANAIAEDKGLYFYGCSSGRDCSCCGDRWYEQYDNSDGLEKEFGDMTLKQKETDMRNGNDQYTNHFVLHYLDGRVVSSRGRIINDAADRW